MDTGRGMSTEFIRESLFTPFAQADSFSVGAGLGVSLAVQLVGRMGGRIEYESAVGKGTTATVTLPIEIVSPAATLDGRNSRPPFLRRNLSEELSGRFTQIHSPPLTHDSDPTPSPSPHLIDPAVPPASVSQMAQQPPFVAVETSEIASSATSPSASPLKVLVVDDNPIALRVLSMWLKTKVRFPFPLLHTLSTLFPHSRALILLPSVVSSVLTLFPSAEVPLRRSARWSGSGRALQVVFSQPCLVFVPFFPWPFSSY
jgi:CheY-like chemotaxis protein